MVHFVELLHPLKHLAENLDFFHHLSNFWLKSYNGRLWDLFFFKKKLKCAGETERFTDNFLISVFINKDIRTVWRHFNFIYF